MFRNSYFLYAIVLVLIHSCDGDNSYCMESEKIETVLVSDDEFPHWRYWDEYGSDPRVNRFNIDKSGNVYAIKGYDSFFFDGYEFKSLPDQNQAYSICSGVEGQFWVQKNDRVAGFDKDGKQVFEVRDGFENDENNFSNDRNRIISIQKDQIFILTKSILYSYDAQLDQIEILKESNDTKLGSFREIRTDHEQMVWVVGDHGVASIAVSPSKDVLHNTWTFYPYPIKHIDNFITVFVFPGSEITLNIRPKNTTTNHLYHLKNGQTRLLHVEDKAMGWLGHDGGFWIRKTVQDGSFRYQYHNQNKIFEIKPNKYTLKMFRLEVPNKHSFWISSENGLASFQAPTWKRDPTIPVTNMRAKDGHFESPNHYYLAQNRRIWMKQEGQWNVIDMPQFEDQRMRINRIANIPISNSIAISFGTSVYQYDPTNANSPFQELLSFDVMNAFQLLPTSKIVYKKNRNSNSLFMYDYKLSNTLVESDSKFLGYNSRKMVLQKENELWYANNGELLYIKEGLIQEPPNYSKDTLGKIDHLFLLSNNHVVFSGEKGIFEYDGNDYIPLSHNNNGEIRDFIYQTPNQYWMIAKDKIYRYQDGVWIDNHAPEGLPTGLFLFIRKDSFNNVYAGGDLGLRIFDPSKDTDPPETYITEEENSKMYLLQPDIRIRLSGNDRWNYTEPDRLLYSYKIDDSAWSEFQENNTVHLNRIPPKRYTIYARAMDRNMNIDPSPATFTFEVVAPWFLKTKTWLFSGIGISLILIFAYFAFRNYGHLKHSLSKTEKTVELLERTKERLSKAKARAEQEKQKAVAATNAKDGFLARMSHEIRTPLNGILGNLELVDMSKQNQEHSGFIHTAIISANALMDIIGDVLDFSKIVADKLELDEKPVSLPTVFQETLSVMNIRAAEKNIHLDSHLSSVFPPAVIADPVRLRQVMMNLIGNAIKFTDQGFVDVTMDTKTRMDGNAVIHFEVMDTGVGFDSHKKDRIFREFEQDETSHKTAEGTGLGLAISKRIIELMGGIIDCESIPGEGSRFWFEVPLQVTDESELEVLDEMISSRDLQFEVSDPILVIDDKKANRYLAMNQLIQLNLACETADNAMEALSKVKVKPYALLLVDCSMPGMDGFEFTQEFRKNEKNTGNRIPVIAMTAHVVSDIHERCLAAGMDDYLSKPVRVHSLTIILKKWLPHNSAGFRASGSAPQNNAASHDFSLEEIAQFTSMNDPEKLNNYLQIVKEDLTKEYKQLQHVIETKNRIAIAEHAHAIKGISESIRYTRLSGEMKNLQTQAEFLSWSEVESKLPKWNQLITRLVDFIASLNSKAQNNQD